jgi:hypothetical protein
MSLKFQNWKHSLQKSLAPETGTNSEKISDITAIRVYSTGSTIYYHLFLLDNCHCPSTIDAANHMSDDAQGTVDNNRYQVQLTASQKQGSLSLASEP